MKFIADTNANLNEVDTKRQSDPSRKAWESVLTGDIFMILEKVGMYYLSLVFWWFPTHLTRTIFYAFLTCWFGAAGINCFWKTTRPSLHMVSLHYGIAYLSLFYFSFMLSIAGLLFTSFRKMFAFSLLMLEYYERKLHILLHIYTLLGKWALHKHI